MSERHYPENAKYLKSEFNRVWQNPQFKASVEKSMAALKYTGKKKP